MLGTHVQQAVLVLARYCYVGSTPYSDYAAAVNCCVLCTQRRTTVLLPSALPQEVRRRALHTDGGHAGTDAHCVLSASLAEAPRARASSKLQVRSRVPARHLQPPPFRVT